MSESGARMIAKFGTSGLLCGLLAACGGPRETVTLPAPQQRVETTTPDDRDLTLTAAPRTVPAAPSVEQEQVMEITAAEMEPPAPSADNQPAPTPSPVDRVRVDAMVGQINGRPVFASEFFEPMDARLRAEAARMTPEEWIAYARESIRSTLVDRIRNELLLAEVESSLSPEQRAGLVTFMRSLRADMVSEARGSEALANRRFLEREGITLEEAVQAERDDELIKSWLRRILQDKVYVPWRDVRFRYERDYDDYNPPATATLRMIRVAAADTDAVSAVIQGIADQDDIDALARRHTTYLAENGGLFERILDGADYASSSLVGLADLNEAAQRLAPGEITGPIEIGSNVYWIKLESIEEKNQSLYDVQAQIQLELFNERARKAENEYYMELLERSGLSQSEAERIGARLLEIAVERYLMSHQNEAS